jgi:hypothetical protein
MLKLELLEEDGKMSDSLIEYRISLKLVREYERERI